MLDNKTLNSIYNGLKSEDKDELIKACQVARNSIGAMDPKEMRAIADALTSVFYIDMTRHSEMHEVIDLASDTLAEMGADIVDILSDNLTDTDLFADFQMAKTLGKIGSPAVAVLKERFRTEQDPCLRSLALYALSTIEDPALIEIFDEVVSAVDHEDQELRSTAVEAIGTMIECIGGMCLDPNAVDRTFEKLMQKVSDSHAGTRAKAVYSIGKLARKEYLNEEQKDRAVTVMKSKLGIDEKHEWDRAFIVRKEAETAFFNLTNLHAHTLEASEYCRD